MNFDELDEFSSASCRVLQVCAINRGENNKALSVKFALTNQEREHFIHSLKRTWIRPQHEGCFLTLMTSSIDDAFKRLIEPLVLRHARYLCSDMPGTGPS